MIRVCIIDDHHIVRRGIQDYLKEQIDMRVVGEGANAREAMNLVRTKDPDVLLLDVALPGQSGVEILTHLLAHKPSMGVLYFSTFPEEHYALPLIKKGARGYLNKDCDPEDIPRAIRTVALGRRYITPKVGDLLAQKMNADNETALPHELLSQREQQIFLRLARGQTVSKIAFELSLSTKSVSTYRTRTLEKMRLSSNSDLTYYAMKAGLIA